jgi:uroporphyrin-3 C-methyltransferase
MTDLEKQEQESSTSEQIEPNEAAENSDSSQKPTMPSQKIAIVALVLALAGLVFSYVKWGELNTTLQQETKMLAAMKDNQQATEARLNESKKSISEQQAAFVKQNERMKMQAEEMEQSLDLVYERVGGSGTQWLVAEAEYLMRIANHRLQLERDSKTALVALARADKRLHDSGDPIWTPIREKLATEMAALNGLEELDLAGHAAQVSGMVSQVDKLKLPNAVTVEDKPAKEESNEKKELSVDSVMQDLWRGLKSILKVRRHDQPVSAMLEPEQTFFLYQNLRLQLEGARVAILRRDQPLFNDSLKRIEAWIKQFFDQDDAVTQSMLQGVISLRELELEAEMPDISGSLRMLMQQQGRGDEMPEQVEDEQQTVNEEPAPAPEEQQPDEGEAPVTSESQLSDSEETTTDETAKPSEVDKKQGDEEQKSPNVDQEPVAKEQKEGT